MPPILIQYHMDHSSFPFCLSATSHPTERNLAPTIHLLNCPIPVTSELLTCTHSHGKLLQKLEHSAMCGSCSLQWYRLHSFPELLRSASFLPPRPFFLAWPSLPPANKIWPEGLQGSVLCRDRIPKLYGASLVLSAICRLSDTPHPKTIQPNPLDPPAKLCDLMGTLSQGPARQVSLPPEDCRSFPQDHATEAGHSGS